jgi:hypothetical protein
MNRKEEDGVPPCVKYLDKTFYDTHMTFALCSFIYKQMHMKCTELTNDPYT